MPYGRAAPSAESKLLRLEREASPRGGVVPEGIAGSDEGRFEEDEEAGM